VQQKSIRAGNTASGCFHLGILEGPGLQRTTMPIQFQPPAMCRVANQQPRLPRATSSLAWNACRDGASTPPWATCSVRHRPVGDNRPPERGWDPPTPPPGGPSPQFAATCSPQSAGLPPGSPLALRCSPRRSDADPVLSLQLQELVCHVMMGNLVMFRKDSVLNILSECCTYEGGGAL